MICRWPEMEQYEQKRLKHLWNPCQKLGFWWNFSFVAEIGRKVLVLRLGVWEIQDMLEKALDEISSNLQEFSGSENFSKKFFGDEVR